MLSVICTMPGAAPSAWAIAGIDGVYMDMVRAPSAVMAATSSVMAGELGFDMRDVIGADGGFAKLRRRREPYASNTAVWKWDRNTDGHGTVMPAFLCPPLLEQSSMRLPLR